MKKRTLIQGAVAVAVVGTMATVGTVVAQADETGSKALGKAIDAILADSRYDGSQVGVVVADAKTGDVLYNHNGDNRGVPASNNKIQTSAAAIGLLGGDYTFKTDVASTGTISGGTLSGDLYLRGTGDPTMSAEDYASLAKGLADSGVTKVDGNLVADDTAFDSQRLGTEWGWDDLPWYYAAETSALNVVSDEELDTGTVRIDVIPGTNEGDEPEIKVTPPNDYVKIDSSASTVAAGGETTVWMNRANGSNTMQIGGDIPAGGEEYWDLLTVSEPTGYAASVFAKALEDNGITVTGDRQVGKATPGEAKSLASHKSMPLSELLVPFMKLSNNMHAEALVKAIGRKVSGEGSFNAGTAAIQDYIKTLGVDSSRIQQVDGSGMSRQNLIPPAEIVKTLVASHGQDWYKKWYDAMPIACKKDTLEGGTLRSRMCDTPAAGNLHGKTGTMTSVSALSGYVTDADGRELAFSMINNDYTANTVKDLEDKVGVTLASFSQAKTLNVESLDVPEPKSYGPSDKECSWVKPIAC